MEENRKKSPMVLILSVIIIVLILLCVKLGIDKAKALQMANEYKTAYEEVKKNEKTAEEYQTAYNQLVSYMLDDAVLAENIGNLTVKVWNNAIWKTSDEETDKYTMVNGQFVSDFNEALKILSNDKDYINNVTTLSNNQLQVKELMKDMLTPPEGYENAFKALEGMYNSYITLTNVVISGNGSLESFSNNFSEADVDLGQKYQAAELYVK